MILRIFKKLIFGSLLLVALAAVLLIPAMMFLRTPTAQAEVILPEPTVRTEANDYVRILVAGSDATSGLCDVLTLISLNRTTDEVLVLQIPRDTYANYTEKNYRKLNGAVSELGGMKEFASFLSEAFGIPIDRTLHLSPSAFRTAVDAIGGVEIELPRDLDYEDPEQGLSIHLKAGKQTLDGLAAEKFVRYRSGYAEGDLDRLDAQKLFLSALFEKVRGLGAIELARLAGNMRTEIDTDLTTLDLVSLSQELLSLSADRVQFVTAPGEAVVATQSGASYYVLSAPAMAELLSLRFGAPEGSFDPKHVFLNERYESFGKIYREYRQYSITGCADGEKQT